jgi:hypothetical protein
MNPKRLRLCLFFFLLALPCAFAYAASGGTDYLTGVFGLPGDIGLLREAGLNAVMLREHEIERGRGLGLRKIYVTGLHASKLKKPDWEDIKRKADKFKEQGDAFDYYIGDDLACVHRDAIDEVKRIYGIKQGMVGVKRSVDCYGGEKVFVYHYPLMRREVSLPEMLKLHVHQRNKHKASGGNGFFIFAEDHLQQWYEKLIEVNRAGPEARLYPDGQAVRMMLHYAVATGADGYVLFYYKGLEGEDSRERVLATAQAMIETRGLYGAMLDAKKVSFFQRAGAYGTVVEGTSHDIIFAFKGDEKTHYHPSTKPGEVGLDDLIDVRKYGSVSEYSVLGSKPARKKLEVPEDHALILIAAKGGKGLLQFPGWGRNGVEKFEAGAETLALYRKILAERAVVLAGNMEKMGFDKLPSLKTGEKDIKGEIAGLLEHIDRLNEMKREAWLARSGKLPMDGDELNRMFWGKEFKGPAKGDVFNFYYKDK